MPVAVIAVMADRGTPGVSNLMAPPDAARDHPVLATAAASNPRVTFAVPVFWMERCLREAFWAITAVLAAVTGTTVCRTLKMTGALLIGVSKKSERAPEETLHDFVTDYERSVMRADALKLLCFTENSPSIWTFVESPVLARVTRNQLRSTSFFQEDGSNSSASVVFI